MLQSEEKNKAKQEFQNERKDGNFLQMLYDFMDDILSSNDPIPFQSFLASTAASFDQYILETARQENLKYISGKFSMTLEEGAKNAAISVPVQISADFYFQTPDGGKWILKEKKGQIDSSYFTDWDTNIETVDLRKTGKLELDIDPPEPDNI